MQRYHNNPIITPEMVKPSRDEYRVRCVFNPGAVKIDDEIILLLRIAEDCEAEEGYAAVPYYRFEKGEAIPEILRFKLDDPDVRLKDTRAICYKDRLYLSTLSHIRVARSKDGINFTIKDSPFMIGSTEYESYGIEDTRINEVEGCRYLTYTSVSPDGWVTSLAETADDFKSIRRKGIIFAPPNKDVCIFSEKINGKYCALHRPHNINLGKPSIWYAESNDLIHWGNHKCVIRPRDNKWECVKIGGGPSPIKTPDGWLEIYHGNGENNCYSLFLMLLDLKDPSKVIARGESPILSSEEPYEKKGFVDNVVFTNGIITEPNGRILIYYGACDQYTCLAETTLDDLLNTL